MIETKDVILSEAKDPAVTAVTSLERRDPSLALRMTAWALSS
jgi:hypothetical protein